MKKSSNEKKSVGTSKSSKDLKKKKTLSIDQVKETLGNFHLIDFIKREELLRSFFAALITKGMISPENNAWMDPKGGKKKQLAGIMKSLQPRGYYKNNKVPTNLQLQAICCHDFNFFIGIDTFKSTSYNDVDVSFIPEAHTL